MQPGGLNRPSPEVVWATWEECESQGHRIQNPLRELSALTFPVAMDERPRTPGRWGSSSEDFRNGGQEGYAAATSMQLPTNGALTGSARTRAVLVGVDPESRTGSTHRLAREMVSEFLGLSDLSTDALFHLATEVIGLARSNRSLELSRLAPLSRRWAATGAVAEFIAGTRLLGVEWWIRPHDEMVFHHESGLRSSVCWEDRGTPDEYLSRNENVPIPGTYQRTILETLGDWIQDGAADFQWGRPIDFVDLNDMSGKDRVLLPELANPGDRFVASIDPGSRVWGEIVEWNDEPDPSAEQLGYRRGRIGSKLGKHDICDVSEAGWAWSIATEVGPIRLPGEHPGEIGDPFAVEIHPEVSRKLHDWASAREPNRDLTGYPWVTKADIWTARCRLEISARSGDWYYFENAVRAVVDGDEAELQEAISRLP